MLYCAELNRSYDASHTGIVQALDDISIYASDQMDAAEPSCGGSEPPPVGKDWLERIAALENWQEQFLPCSACGGLNINHFGEECEKCHGDGPPDLTDLGNWLKGVVDRVIRLERGQDIAATDDDLTELSMRVADMECEINERLSCISNDWELMTGRLDAIERDEKNVNRIMTTFAARLEAMAKAAGGE
jgi:hypothetical protein